MYKFICPQWVKHGGSFDQSMYQIDHIKELRNGGTNHRCNLQALCPSCHARKTNYMENNGIKSHIKRNVSPMMKKQVAAEQLFRCANVPTIFRYKSHGIGGLFGLTLGIFGKVLYDHTTE